MGLYLAEDLIKAAGDLGNAPKPPSPTGGAPKPPSPSGASMSQPQPAEGMPTPEMGDASGDDQYKPCSVGGGQACLRAGGNGADTHKVGGEIERRHSEYMASAGAGAAQTETAEDASTTTPEEVMQDQQEAAPAKQALDPNATIGTTSVDPDAYPEDSDPLDHYLVGSAHRTLGGDNDSAKEIAEGHRQIARKRAESFGPDEHEELAQKLRDAGMHEDADWHAKEADQQRRLEQEKDEGVAQAEKIAEDVEADAKAKDKAAVDEQFDALLEDTKDVPDQLDARDESLRQVEKLGEDVEARAASKEQQKEDDPHAAAMEEWEQQKQELEDKHAQEMEEYKKKVDEEHEKTVSEWEQKKKDYDAWEKLAEEHKQAEPEEPAPVTETRPKSSDYNMGTPEGAAKFDRDVKDFEKKKKQYDKDKAKYRAQKHSHKAEGMALKKQKPDNPGKKPKHPGYKKDAPEKPEIPEKPKPEEFAPKKPSSPAETAKHTEYTSSAKTAYENIQSHLEGNKDLSDAERKKLEAAAQALESHASSDRMPTKEQQAEVKEMIKVAGEHGKAPHQDEEAQAEEAKTPETDLERIQLSDHKTKAEELRSNIQENIKKLQSDADMPPAQRDQKIKHLQEIHSTLEEHTKLDKLPTSEQQNEMKELTKIAGEHGKKPKEDKAGGKAGDAKEEKTSSSSSSSRRRGANWAHAFGRGAAVGSRIAQAAETGMGAGDVGAQALGIAAGGVMQAGENLLHKPISDTLRDQKKKKNSVKAAGSDEEASKKAAEGKTTDKKTSTKDKKTMKGLYISLEADLDLMKAVNAPNAGSTEMTGERAKDVAESSYTKHPVGVMGGSEVAMEDDPDVGAQWKHSDDEDEEDTEKSDSALEILKSLRGAVEEDLSRVRYNPREIEFMKEELGYSDKDIQKGIARIRGRDRHRFHEWALNRVNSALSGMLGRYV